MWRVKRVAGVPLNKSTITSLTQAVKDVAKSQYATPTLVNDLAKSLTQIIDKNIFGLFHASGSTCINRYDFALLLAKKFRYDSKLIKPVTSKEKKQIAIIIPIRGKKLDPHSIALRELGGVRVLDWTIQSCLRLKKEVNIIVTSSDKDVLKYTKETYQDRVIVIERSYKLATLNSHLGDTISYVLNQYKKLGYKDPESIAQLSIESPFRKSRHIDSALDVLNLFDVDCIKQ